MKNIKCWSVLFVTALSILVACGQKPVEQTTPVQSYTILDPGISVNVVSVNELAEEEIPPFEEFDIHIMMVGDDLMHMGVINSGKQDDGTYNYDYMYEDIKPYLDIADIKIINQETVFAGDDLGFSGYPAFNSPRAMADSIAKAGFNVVLHASNHACDKGISGLNATKKYWDETHPDVMVVGVYGEEELNRDIPIVEVEGVKFAILNYTYSANWATWQPNLEYHLNMLTSAYSDRTIDLNSLNPMVIEDIKRAKEVADMVIVAPHWGIEYMTVENDYQDWVAKAMVEAGADIIIATHPHVPQPVKWIEADNGNRGLCYFSLGNYLSTQYKPDTLFEGLAWVTVRVTEEGPVIKEEDTGVLPMVLNYKSGPTRILGVVALENWTDDMAVGHGAQNLGGSVPYLSYYESKRDEIFGDFAISINKILGGAETAKEEPVIEKYFEYVPYDGEAEGIQPSYLYIEGSGTVTKPVEKTTSEPAPAPTPDPET